MLLRDRFGVRSTSCRGLSDSSSTRGNVPMPQSAEVAPVLHTSSCGTRGCVTSPPGYVAGWSEFVSGGAITEYGARIIGGAARGDGATHTRENETISILWVPEIGFAFVDLRLRPSCGNAARLAPCRWSTRCSVGSWR